MWKIIGKTDTSGQMDLDSWGLRKFVSYFVKRFKQVHKPRDPRLNAGYSMLFVGLCENSGRCTFAVSPEDPKVCELKRILLTQWAPHRLCELDCTQL